MNSAVAISGRLLANSSCQLLAWSLASQLRVAFLGFQVWFFLFSIPPGFFTFFSPDSSLIFVPFGSVCLPSDF